MAKAAAARRGGVDPQHLIDDALGILEEIRTIDARIGLLDAAVNQRSTWFAFDISENLVDYGFGLDDNGNYPAL